MKHRVRFPLVIAMLAVAMIGIYVSILLIPAEHRSGGISFKLATFSLMFGFGMLVVVSMTLRDILGKLARADVITRQFSEGDLTGRILVRSNVDELDGTLSTINRLGENIAGIAGQIITANQTLLGAADEFSNTFSSISKNAQQVRERTGSVAAASEQVSTNILTISSGTEEMSASVNGVALSMEEMSSTIAEVTRNCQQEAAITKQAQTEVSQTEQLMHNLGDSAKEIGRIIATINDIADKTNLLALNATIEAASAGDAGKGFEVVANEVKALSRQTSKATTIIREQIEKMQKDTQASMGAMTTISGVIDEVYSISHTIAAAVEEQSVTANEISRNLNEVSSVATGIARNISEIAQGTNDVSRNLSFVNNETRLVAASIVDATPQVEDLVTLGNELKSLVSTFKIKADVIQWSDEFSVKVPEMDEQHKRLVGMINSLNEAVSSGKTRSAVMEVLDGLVEYVNVHFRAEEKLLEDTGSPELSSQKQIHATFVERVLAFRDEFVSGKALVGTKIILFLKDWLVGHIMHKDKLYGPWVNKHRR